MKVVAVNVDTKQDVEAEMFDKVVYNLHPSFGIKAKQSQLHHSQAARRLAPCPLLLI
jgi:transcription initiation factor IIF auxiliary subunit